MSSVAHLVFLVRVAMAAVLLFPCALFAQDERGALVVEITGFRNSDGQVGVLLFPGEEGFPMDHRQAVKKIFAGIDRNASRVRFENIPYGIYGVSVFHDENADGKLKKNFFGIPREGIGVSRNPAIRFGPPRFKEANFTLDSNEQRLAITIRYLQ
ncbi:MAG: DUF2141 domain-containing protein [Deltaproteobacteria bacterium]|nr:DUF2141 domain-containing protein [Deltaproteobacteria bacterium]TLN01045.1 MAG: DUF2141 domain-containing protein [bacterium]